MQLNFQKCKLTFIYDIISKTLSLQFSSILNILLLNDYHTIYVEDRVFTSIDEGVLMKREYTLLSVK